MRTGKMDLATSSKYDLNIARSWISLFFLGFPIFLKPWLPWRMHRLGSQPSKVQGFPVDQLRSGKLYKKKLEEVSLWHVCIYKYIISPKVTHVFLGQLVWECLLYRAVLVASNSYCCWWTWRNKSPSSQCVKARKTCLEMWVAFHGTWHSWFKAKTALAVVGPISTIDHTTWSHLLPQGFNRGAMWRRVSHWV